MGQVTGLCGIPASCQRERGSLEKVERRWGASCVHPGDASQGTAFVGKVGAARSRLPLPPSSQGPLELPCFLGATEQPRCVVLGCFSGDAAARLSSNLIRVKNKLTASVQSEVVRDSFLLTFNRRGSKVDRSTFGGEGSHLTLNSCG